MSISDRKNIGAYLHGAFACVATTQTAGAAAEVTGVGIDRTLNGEPLSCSVLYAVTSTLANTHTFSLAYKIQHSSDNSTFTDFAVGASTAALVLTGVSGGAAQNALVKHDVDLNGAKQYIRVDFTPTFSAGSVDTATVTPVIAFGGMSVLP